VLLVEGDEVNVVVADDIATPLLDGDIVVPPVERVQVRPSGKRNLEAHLRIAHEVAVLQTIVRDGERRQPHGAGFVHGFDNQCQIGRVLDLEVQAVVPTSGLSKDVKDGLH
jgi:hypothetical protein